MQFFVKQLCAQREYRMLYFMKTDFAMLYVSFVAAHFILTT